MKIPSPEVIIQTVCKHLVHIGLAVWWNSPADRHKYIPYWSFNLQFYYPRNCFLREFRGHNFEEEVAVHEYHTHCTVSQVFTSHAALAIRIIKLSDNACFNSWLGTKRYLLGRQIHIVSDHCTWFHCTGQFFLYLMLQYT